MKIPFAWHASVDGFTVTPGAVYAPNEGVASSREGRKTRISKEWGLGRLQSRQKAKERHSLDVVGEEVVRVAAPMSLKLARGVAIEEFV